MGIRIRIANWLSSMAYKIAVVKGRSVRRFHHHDRTIDVSYIDPEKPGDGKAYDGRLYRDAVLYLGDNAQPSYIDPMDDECDECGAEGQKIHSQLFKAVLESDSEEKFFSDSLKKWVQYAAFAGAGAFFAALMAAIMVYQYAG